MIRRDFFRRLSVLSALPVFPASAFTTSAEAQSSQAADRSLWINHLTKIADPVLMALSQEKLKATMPVESKNDRRGVTHLEAIGRLLAGMAPWLELGGDSSEEGKRRQHYLDLSLRSIVNAVNPKSKDYLNFSEGGNGQPLVDAAFLAHALIRSPRQLWGNMGTKDRQNLITALRATRVIKPHYSNWLLFSAMIEAALLQLGEPWDEMRVDFAIKKHLDWYKGDGMYGDGPDFHFDYYNSYVIQPMMLDVLRVLKEKGKAAEEGYNLVLARARRYAAIQERLIGPDGTFPAVGRSLVYRGGAFQLLAQISLMGVLPEGISPAQVRSALTAVIRKTLEAPGTFDANGWLQIGLAGHQPNLGETYISTGSLYLCSVGFLPLGLPATDVFWTAPDEDWTSRKVWSGKDLPPDKALGK